jgi:hypothetical protein
MTHVLHSRFNQLDVNRSVTVPVVHQLMAAFARTAESVLKTADDIHAFMQNANNQDSLLIVRIEDHMAFVKNTAVALSYVVHSATHLRIVAEQFKAVGEGLKIGFGSLDTEVEHGAGQYSLDITGSRFGKLIHRDRAGP